ncbi:MAG: Rpn family recombination-promoting nuclease/putative transposase [Spirochaetaceae bacterium]|nr:Rpn family recombination-promoting nuclease/putative transposase [Spirochaetaceae bacterium]
MLVLQNKTRRNYKDSVFVDLFAHDITAKENFISLYNALHGTNLEATTTEIQPVMIEKVLYMKYYNDVAMLVDGKIVVMIEHQSTINENMPFRFLEYIARIYEKIVNVASYRLLSRMYFIFWFVHSCNFSPNERTLQNHNRYRKNGVAENNQTKPCKRSAAPASLRIFGESHFFSGTNYFCKIL